MFRDKIRIVKRPLSISTYKSRRGSGEKSVFFRSIYKCNQNCLFCVRTVSKYATLSTKESKEKIKELADRGYSKLVFDGGEPTLRKDLPDLIAYAISKGFSAIEILTNAVILEDRKLTERILKEMRKAHHHSFSVSLHAHRPQLSDELTQTTGTFQRTLKGLKNLCDLGTEISIYHIITRLTQGKTHEFVEFVHKAYPKVKNITFSFIYPEGSALEHLELLPQLSKLESSLYKAINLCKKYNISFAISTCGTLPLCYLRGHESALINTQNLWQPHKVRVLDSSQDQGYQLSTPQFHSESKLKSSRCTLCVLNELCPGLWKPYAKEYGLSELKPVYNYTRYPILTHPNQESISDPHLKNTLIVLNFDLNEDSPLEDIREAFEYIKTLKKSDTPYLVARPLPLHNLGVSTRELLELGIPINCTSCKNLFRVTKGRAILCNGIDAGPINQYHDSHSLYEALKKGPRNRSCWFSQYVS